MPKTKTTQTAATPSDSLALDYAEANLALEEVLAKLQQPGLQVDEAARLYEAGLKLIQQLEGYLEAAENKIEQIKLAAEKAQAGQGAV